MIKECRKCNRKLSVENFFKYQKSKDGKDGYCKECRKVYQMDWSKNNQDKVKLKRKVYYLKNSAALQDKRREREKNNPEKSKQQRAIYARRYLLKSKYGLTETSYEKIFDSQQGKCAICGLKSEKVLRVDHNHKTGRIRSLLCDRCNIKLGYYEVYKDFHTQAEEYLLKH